MMKKDTIIRLIRSKKNRPLTREDIARQLRLPPARRPELDRTLDKMEASGEVIRVKQGRYAVPKELGLVVGRLEVNPRGFGFVIPEEGKGEDIYIHQENMNRALDGDTVLVRLEPARRRRAGEVVRVVKRGSGEIVGTLEQTGSLFYLVPDNPSLIHDIYIDRSGLRESHPGEKVTVRITGWPSKHLNPAGEVVEVLGQAGVPRVDTLSSIRQHGLREEYPPAALRGAEGFEAGVTEEELAGRTDLRNLVLFTVDPDDARDFDDAVSIEKKKNGEIVLGVHIADVSHYVPAGSALDREARERGTSVYLPARVLHMLPPRLATEVCSLQPDQDRLAQSVFLTFTADGERKEYRFHRSVIRSRRRFTYGEVRAILLEKDPAGRQKAGELTGLLEEMSTLARRLRERRFARGAFDLDLPESKIVFDGEGLIADVRLEESDLSHWLIEEFMLAANEAAADYLARKKAPLIYRAHEDPDREDLEEFGEFAAAFGHPVKNVGNRRELQKFLDSVRETPLATILQTAFVRSLKQAEYSAAPLGHYGLAVPRYTYFTSPIRRYPDLYNHRLLDCLFDDIRPEQSPNLQALVRHCSETERIAQKAERDMLQLRKLQFFSEHLRDRDRPVFEGVITGVKNFGFTVYLNRYLLAGLVHVSSLTDDFYRLDRSRTRFRGRRTGREFRVGDRVRVRVEKVDMVAKQIDFIIFPSEK
jgi:ribonuclease R